MPGNRRIVARQYRKMDDKGVMASPTREDQRQRCIRIVADPLQIRLVPIRIENNFNVLHPGLHEPLAVRQVGRGAGAALPRQIR